jgi:hypothetical protein
LPFDLLLQPAQEAVSQSLRMAKLPEHFVQAFEQEPEHSSNKAGAPWRDENPISLNKAIREGWRGDF